MTESQRPPFKQLPPRPDIKHLKNQAKLLLEAHQRGDLEATRRIQASLQQLADVSLPEILKKRITLQQAQHVIAREYGFHDWSALLESLRKKTNTYDRYADLYADQIAKRKTTADTKLASLDLPLHYLLDYAGDVKNLTVLDAGCGEGHVSRILSNRGAQVTGIDISPRFIDIARSKDEEDKIDFRVHDLSQPMPQFTGHFDLVVSNLVLNDVPDYMRFISTLGSVVRSGGRVVLSMNNPYSAVPREKVDHYFDSGTSIVYWGIYASSGIKVFYYHRTLEDYIAAFRDSGFLLKSLSDVCPTEEMLHADPGLRERWYRFPVFMVLEFVKQ